MECMDEQERYQNGNLSREFIPPILGQTVLDPPIENEA
jgi:hypothetical protein